MTRTRRGVMVVMAGSALTLLTNTLGYSAAQVERDVTIAVVADGEALLQLRPTDEEDRRSPLEDGEEYDSPHEIDVGNAFESTIHVTFESKGGCFEFEAEPFDDDDDGFEVRSEGELLEFGLKAGRQALVTVYADEECTETVVVTAQVTEGLEEDAETKPVRGRLEREITLTGTDEDDVEDDSAWAILADGVEPDPDSNRLSVGGSDNGPWRWYMPYTIGSGPVDAEFWAGAGNFDLENGTQVGEVELDDDGEGDEAALIVEITMFEEFSLEESHLNVDTDAENVPNGPGQFTYDDDDEEYDDEETTYTIPLKDVGDEDGVEDDIFVVLHGDPVQARRER